MIKSILSVLALATTLSATTIVGETTSDPGLQAGLTIAVGWTQSSTWTNVAITGLFATNASQASVTAYLTNQIGVGTTAANQIGGSSTLAVPSGGNHWTLTLFSGLTLGSGTYYLTVQPSDVNGGGGTGYIGTGTPTDTLGPGVTFLGVFMMGAAGYAPAGTPSTSIFPATFSVTGSVTGGQGAPEPGTFGLLAAGAALMLGLHRRRWRKNRAQ